MPEYKGNEITRTLNHMEISTGDQFVSGKDSYWVVSVVSKLDVADTLHVPIESITDDMMYEISTRMNEGLLQSAYWDIIRDMEVEGLSSNPE